MSDYPFLIPRPFTDGYVSDLPVEQLGQRMAASLLEYIFPRGFLERRRGFAFDGTVADFGAVILQSVVRDEYKRMAVTRTMTTGGTGAPTLLVHNAAAAGTAINNWGAPWDAPLLPRCIYRDERIFCFQNGVGGIIRYGGGTAGYSPGVPTPVAGERRIATGALPAGIGLGSFMGSDSNGGLANRAPVFSFRLTKAVAAAADISVDHWLPSVGALLAQWYLNPMGYAAPCVNVYDAGTFSQAAAAATGIGTAWATNNNVVDGGVDLGLGGGGANDAILSTSAAAPGPIMSSVAALISNSALTVVRGANAVQMSYAILRRMPFRDAAVFRRCFFGTGVDRFGSRAYYYPPGADIGLPPAYFDGRDYDPAVAVASPNPTTDFMMAYVAVPSDVDADPIVALLPTETAMYLPKRDGVYQIAGDWPSFSVDKIGEGAGCLDIRSAITTQFGVFWAGATGVWTIRGGRPYNLCGGSDRPGILTEWMNLMREGITGPTSGSTSWVSCGVTPDGHLIVSVRTATATERCFVLHLPSEKWCGRFTNVVPRHMTVGRVAGEVDKLFGVQDLDVGRVVELSAMFRTAVAGSAAGAVTDGDGVAPLAIAHTGSRVFFPQSESNEGRLTDLKLTVKAYDTATPSTTITPTIVHGDGYDATVDTTTALAGFDADTTNVAHTKIYRPGTRGRRQQLQIVQTDQDAEFSTIEIHEIAGTVRTYSRRR